MADTTLVNADILRGRAVVDAARGRGIELQGAFWRHDHADGRWRLVLISEEAAAGSWELLGRIASTVAFEDLVNVEFRPPSDRIYRAVNDAPGSVSAEGKRVQYLIAQSDYIDDAYVYSL